MLQIKTSRRVTYVTVSISKPKIYLDEALRIDKIWYFKDVRGVLTPFDPNTQKELECEFKKINLP